MSTKTKSTDVAVAGTEEKDEALLRKDGTVNVKAAQKLLAAALSKQYEAQSAILRQGDKIVVPSWMELSAAERAIHEFIEQQDEDVQILCEFDCHPNDGLVNFYEAVKQTFGNLLGAATETFFGKIPGKNMAVPIAYGETVNIPVGLSEVPGLPIKMSLRPNYDPKHVNGGSFSVIFQCKRKYEPLVRDIERLTKERLVTNSIFRAKAIDSQFEFLNLGAFDPSKLVYSERIARQVQANIISPIEDADLWRKSGSSLKRGILLCGAYGTGKTLTARAVAVECQEHGWTFINVRPGDDIRKALAFAKKYQPAVVFFEDIDQETGGSRDERLNQILNTVDGVVGKNDELMIILTTNHIEKVSRAMLRPGRLDSVIELGELDQPALLKLVKACLIDNQGKDMLVGGLDGPKLMDAATGYLPAFIVEAVTKAKAYAMSRGSFQSDGTLAITSQDVEDALVEVRPQFRLMSGTQQVDAPTLDKTLGELVTDKVTEVVQPTLEKMEEWIAKNS